MQRNHDLRLYQLSRQALHHTPPLYGLSSLPADRFYVPCPSLPPVAVVKCSLNLHPFKPTACALPPPGGEEKTWTHHKNRGRKIHLPNHCAVILYQDTAPFRGRRKMNEGGNNRMKTATHKKKHKKKIFRSVAMLSCCLIRHLAATPADRQWGILPGIC